MVKTSGGKHRHTFCVEACNTLKLGRQFSFSVQLRAFLDVAQQDGHLILVENSLLSVVDLLYLSVCGSMVHCHSGLISPIRVCWLPWLSW